VLFENLVYTSNGPQRLSACPLDLSRLVKKIWRLLESTDTILILSAVFKSSDAMLKMTFYNSFEKKLILSE